jgi:oxalate decarboxylase
MVGSFNAKERVMPVPEKKSRHVASLEGLAPRFAGPTGSIKHLDNRELPILRGLSLRRLDLAPRGVREPHWHANAHELGFCLQGGALITIATNHAEREIFTVAAGDMFFAPSGSLHAIQNTGSGTAAFILAFSHEQPEDFGIKAAFGAMSDSVLGNTYGLPAAAFRALDRTSAENSVFALPQGPAIEDQARHVNPYKYSLAATPAQIESPAGTAQITRSALWPALRDIAMFSVTISEKGMREPHWHPETAEMGYVISGMARMTILDPDGSADTYVAKPGDAYFIPRAYPHHIENVGEGQLHLAIFFDSVSPGDIGYRSLINVFPRDVLAAAFGMAVTDLPPFPLTEIDPLLVSRSNPIEPVA